MEEDMEVNREDMEDSAKKGIDEPHKSLCGIEQMTSHEGPGGGCSPCIS